MLPVSYSRAPGSRFCLLDDLAVSAFIIFSTIPSSPRGKKRKNSVNRNLQMEFQAGNICMETRKKIWCHPYRWHQDFQFTHFCHWDPPGIKMCENYEWHKVDALSALLHSHEREREFQGCKNSTRSIVFLLLLVTFIFHVCRNLVDMS